MWFKCWADTGFIGHLCLVRRGRCIAAKQGFSQCIEAYFDGGIELVDLAGKKKPCVEAFRPLEFQRLFLVLRVCDDGQGFPDIATRGQKTFSEKRFGLASGLRGCLRLLPQRARARSAVLSPVRATGAQGARPNRPRE